MSAENKGPFDAAAAAAAEGASASGDEPSVDGVDAKGRRKRRRTGLRVPADNVSRPTEPVAGDDSQPPYGERVRAATARAASEGDSADLSVDIDVEEPPDESAALTAREDVTADAPAPVADIHRATTDRITAAREPSDAGDTASAAPTGEAPKTRTLRMWSASEGATEGKPSATDIAMAAEAAASPEDDRGSGPTQGLSRLPTAPSERLKAAGAAGTAGSSVPQLDRAWTDGEDEDTAGLDVSKPVRPVTILPRAATAPVTPPPTPAAMPMPTPTPAEQAADTVVSPPPVAPPPVPEDKTQVTAPPTWDADVVSVEAAPDAEPSAPSRDRAATVIDEEEEISADMVEVVAEPPASGEKVQTVDAQLPPAAAPPVPNHVAPQTSPPPTPAQAKKQVKAPPTPPPAPKKPPPQPGQESESKPRRRRAKAWFEEIFDEDYLRTLPFLTPQITQREAAFIAEALNVQPGNQVLDVGCGYGRHAMELAARGYHVVGLDLSLPLLIRGADEAQRRGLTINFVHGDMRDLSFDAQFDGAYCVFSTFGYFDDETNKRVAGNVAKALKPGGRLVIEILNRDYVIADLPARVWWEGDGCVVLEEVEFNYFTSRVISKRSVVFEDGRQLEQEISMRSYSLHEMGKLLHQAGFRVLEVSGSLATRGHFFGRDSRQIIVVAERRVDAPPVTARMSVETPALNPAGHVDGEPGSGPDQS